ncbi:NmrA family NAD(P)-binding protein [Gordonia sp. L191]|uniref:NmrA family NAD(P)-binding protein n=1 Tax=Gordonia sp. L191 TaxID=2982699 RepID=UPI0024BFB255|nr:NmrA family NAD(P)-binding protein [Gordonia sp. L191]WHU45821.1 NmrA family NAD(P)-binding protein [Gordonia sp. L191]
MDVSAPKEPLRRILVFGANNHIGGPCAELIARTAQATALRVVTSKPEVVPVLQEKFPTAEVVLADYLDLPSLLGAFDDVDGCFVVTPDFMDEETAMTNIVAAARHHGRLRHMVRLVADPIGMTLGRVPKALIEFDGGGTAVQHLKAKAVLDRSGLPITYINNAAYFMDNFLTFFAAPIQQHRKLVVPRNRRMAFLDTTDTGECAASILLSDNARHIGQIYHLDNGHDVMRFDEVARLAADVLGVPIEYDGTDEAFERYCGDGLRAYIGTDDAVEYYLHYFQFEQDNETVWRKSDIVEYLTGRPARHLDEWLAANRDAVLGQVVAV